MTDVWVTASFPVTVDEEDETPEETAYEDVEEALRPLLAGNNSAALEIAVSAND